MLRIFPQFIEGDARVVEPSTFKTPVTIQQFFPNFIKVTFSPFSDINVEIEYWVPGSQVIAARTKLYNTSTGLRTIRVEWAVVLNPLPGGQRMIPMEVGLTPVLSGKSEGIQPIFYMAGGAKPGSGPFPSLTLPMQIQPKDSTTVTWTFASLGDLEASYQLAQQTSVRNWEAETARILRVNAEQIDIHTGDPDWDLALALAQYRALNLMLQGTGKLAFSSFVSNRLPDQGYSYRGDGSDYSHQWNGQTPLETSHIIDLLLPGNAELAKGLLLNFLGTQTEVGFIDWKPGLAGQRSQTLATPLLASIAWRLYQVTDDLNFLQQAFSGLLAFVQHWFSAPYDRDGDGIPEWYHPMQTGLDEHPLFSTWASWSRGIDIRSVESPDLSSFLYNECILLTQIARLVGRPETIPAIQAFADHLHTAVEAAWNNDCACYSYWDRDGHIISNFEILGTRTGPGEVDIQRVFEKPIRVHIQIQSSDEATRPLQIYIHGSAHTGGHRVEKITNEEVRWHHGRCHITSERIYSALEHVEFHGLFDTDEISIQTVGHTDMDISTLIPLWAGIPNEERANDLITHTLSNPKMFWGRFGIRTKVENQSRNARAARHYNNVNVPYNCLLGYGLLRYGQVNKAAELVMHIMKAVIQSLRNEGVFHHTYNADTGQGGGERNSLSSLPPLGLFLEVLGVRIINPHKVIVSGTNPYPWPVTVKYKGLSVLRQKNKTLVIFPDGQNIIIKNGKTQVVELES